MLKHLADIKNRCIFVSSNSNNMEMKINIIEVGDKRYSQFRETEKAVGIWNGTITVWIPKKALQPGDVVGQFWVRIEDWAQFKLNSQKFYNNLKK